MILQSFPFCLFIPRHILYFRVTCHSGRGSLIHPRMLTFNTVLPLYEKNREREREIRVQQICLRYWVHYYTSTTKINTTTRLFLSPELSEHHVSKFVTRIRRKNFFLHYFSSFCSSTGYDLYFLPISQLFGYHIPTREKENKFLHGNNNLNTFVILIYHV